MFFFILFQCSPFELCKLETLNLKNFQLSLKTWKCQTIRMTLSNFLEPLYLLTAKMVPLESSLHPTMNLTSCLSLLNDQTLRLDSLTLGWYLHRLEMAVTSNSKIQLRSHWNISNPTTCPDLCVCIGITHPKHGPTQDVSLDQPTEHTPHVNVTI